MWAANYSNPTNNIENCCIYQAVMKQRRATKAKTKPRGKSTTKPKTKARGKSTTKPKKKARGKKLLSSVKLQQKAAGYMLAAANARKMGR